MCICVEDVYKRQKVDEDHTAIRLCTSWATRDEAVEQLIADIRALGKEL